MPTLTICAEGSVVTRTYEQTSSAVVKSDAMAIYRSAQQYDLRCADGAALTIELRVHAHPCVAVWRYVPTAEAIEWLTETTGTIQIGSREHGALQCNVSRANGVVSIESFSLFVSAKSSLWSQFSASVDTNK